MTIGEAGITNNDDDLQSITCNILLRSSQRWSVGPGGLSVSGTINTDIGDLLLIDGAGNTMLSGVISNTGGLAKDGLGTLTLNSSLNNTYTGQTFIHGGVLQVGNGTAAGSLGTGAVTDNATLAFNRSDVFTVSNPISGSGIVQQIGSGTLILSGSNSYSGTTTVTNGILKLANPSALGSIAGGTIVQNSGALDLNGLTISNELLTIYGMGSGGNGALVNNNTSATAIFNGAVTLGGNAGTGGLGNITLAGSINYGSFAFTKNGSGTLTLTGSQNWGNNASVTVLAGTLSYQQTAGVSTTLGITTPTLHITAGSVVNDYASNIDPFTDSINPSQHVQIVNDLGGSFNLMAGTSSVAGISGAGSTYVASGSTLNSNYIYQGTLTLAPGSRVVINPIIGGPTAPLSSLSSALNSTPISNSATNDPAAISTLDMTSSSSQTGVNNPAGIPTSSAPVGLTLVPEPATWILIIIGALCLICLGKRK